MIFISRKSSRIAIFAALFCLVSYQVDAHCVYHDGRIDHTAHACDPTVSPAPTESPAPSPSPSEVPTNTQQPSESLEPSTTPTDAPTTSSPSADPTESPTESPAPSPSPSQVPSAAPTDSAAPSANPTDRPSESPSQNPSGSPTLFPTSSPSESPTGPLLLTVVDVEFTIANVTGEREMSPENIRYFETETTLYLKDQIQEAPGVTRIEVENIIVKDQKFVKWEFDNIQFDGEPGRKDPFLRKQRHLEEIQTDLIITIDLVVAVVLNRTENLQMNAFFEEFFEIPDHKNELRSLLEKKETFYQEIFLKGYTKSSESSETAKKTPTNRKAVTGTVVALVALIVGSGLLWMWMQSRRVVSRRSNDSGKIENLGTISKSFESDDKISSIPSSDSKKDIYDEYIKGQPVNNVRNEDENRRNSTLSQLMYVPTLMPTESNIEVPDTPVTAFAVNGFATPANGNGFMTPVSASGFMTPKSTKSKGVGDKSTNFLPKLLGESSPDEALSPENILKDINLTKSRSKIPLPPKILGPLKSPFRRETKKDDKEYDSSSMSGVGVVAGKNNVREKAARIENKYSKTLKKLRDLPSEIGGPSIPPSQAAPIGTTVVPVEENVVSRPPTSRKNKNNFSYPKVCPPPEIGGPSETNLPSTKSARTTDHSVRSTRSTRSAKTKDHSVVDIVDEIAYLYSTNSAETEKYKDSSSKR